MRADRVTNAENVDFDKTVKIGGIVIHADRDCSRGVLIFWIVAPKSDAEAG